MRNKDYIITHQKVMNSDEVLSLKRVCERHFSLIKDRRNALVITLALECGLRACEVLGLTVGDFSASESSVTIRSYKGSNARVLPIKATLARELKKWIMEESGVSQWHQLDKARPIFNFTYDRLHQIWKWYTPNQSKTFHSLRHTFAVRLYMKCKDLKAVQLALGHRNINNTMVYVDFVYNQTIMRKLMA